MSEITEKLLADIVWPEQKYARSTNIEFDNRNLDSIPEYKFTSKSLRFLDDILDSTYGARRDRAWSIIGPYGSGKSTFILLLLQLLGGISSSWLRRCIVQLQLASPEMEQKLSKEIFKNEARYITIAVQGSRTPLDLSLCKALFKVATDQERDISWVSEGFLSSLNTAIQTMEAGVSDSRFTVDLYEQAANLAKIAGYRGLFIAIDEFGKYLERARWQGDLPDLAAAQYLAELASSIGEPQILFTVALHQGFQHYAASLSRQQWLEWVKIQGRFRQVDFSEQPENLYGLVAASLNINNKSLSVRESLGKWVSRVWNQVNDIPAFETEANTSFWPNLLLRVYPFHPIALYALPRLSSYLGQNERTLFTFLASDDPLGLKSFLKSTREETDELPSLTLDYLYDYFITGARFAWLPIDVQRKVNEIESALERLGDRPPIEIKLIKAIGVLNLLKTSSLMPASDKVLYAALDIGSHGSLYSIRESIDRLLARKLIVYRQFAGEYRIWQGSDFDFDGEILKAKEEIQIDLDLPCTLEKELELKPLLARRHSFETGTTRLFTIKFMTAADLTRISSPDIIHIFNLYTHDGIIIYTLPRNLQELRDFTIWACSIIDPRILIVLPREPLGIDHLVLELAALRKIQSECLDLKEDNVANKELGARIEAAQDFLDESLAMIIEPTIDGSAWYWTGKERCVNNLKELNRLLSEVCDEVYLSTPIIRNELINRQNLSSSVIVAVKKIISALLTEEGKARLGFEGNGPEVSIYRAVLEKQGIYHQSFNGKWCLCRPTDGDTDGINMVWIEIERFLESTNDTSKSFDLLYETLARPPYGVRRGLVSLLIWIVLIYYRDVISLYEQGTYIREWAAEIFDRFVRSPNTFTVRRLVLSFGTGNVLQMLNECIPGATKILKIDDGVPLTGFLRNLYNWYRSLPEYTKRTNRLSPKAKEFRRILLTVVDPVEFIFESIPNVLGCESVYSILESSKRQQKESLKRYVQTFSSTIAEIDEAYCELIKDITVFTSTSFNCHAHVADLKRTFKDIDEQILERLTDTDVKAFLLHTRQTYDSDIQWIEAITSILSGQSPKYWLDNDYEKYKDNISIVVLKLHEAHKRYYARTMLGLQQQQQMKRITIEEHGELIVESYLLDCEFKGEIEEATKALLKNIYRKYPNLSFQSKQMVLTKALELLIRGDINASR